MCCSFLALAAPAAVRGQTAQTKAPAPPKTPSAAATPASPADLAARRAEAKAIIEVMFPPATREATIQRTIEELNSSMLQTLQVPDVQDPGLKAIFDRFLVTIRAETVAVTQQTFPRTLAATEGAYTRAFTLAELKDIHAFARTPAGQKYVSRSPTLMLDPEVRAANLAAMAEGRARTRAIMEAFKAEVLAYVRKRPNSLRPRISQR
jgi:hypothetical protein